MARDRSRRPSLIERQPALHPAREAELQTAAARKRALRESLLRLADRPRPVGAASALSPAAAQLAIQGLRGQPPPRAPVSLDLIRNPTCKVLYDANSRLTTMVGTAEIHQPMHEMLALMDPRSWDRGGGVIAKVFPVFDDQGEYEPRTDPQLDQWVLGARWHDDLLLYEYARSEIAAFENILRIPAVDIRGPDDAPESIQVYYELYECLTCIVGLLSVSGGLTVNTGWVKATPARDPEWSVLEIVKRVKVRDLNPQDPGNRYDFGEWANSMIGATLSLFVEDTSLLSPFC